jgi:hypothetical protein
MCAPKEFSSEPEWNLRDRKGPGEEDATQAAHIVHKLEYPVCQELFSEFFGGPNFHQPTR